MEEKKRNQCFIFLMVVGTVLLFFPLLTLGIMHNDELLARYWSMRGVKEFLTHSYTELLQGKGRAMSCLVVPVTQILWYIGKSRYCFRILQVLTVISNIGLFAKLTEEIFHKKDSDRYSDSITGIVYATFFRTHTSECLCDFIWDTAYIIICIFITLYLLSPYRKEKIYDYSYDPVLDRVL